MYLGDARAWIKAAQAACQKVDAGGLQEECLKTSEIVNAGVCPRSIRLRADPSMPMQGLVQALLSASS